MTSYLRQKLVSKLSSPSPSSSSNQEKENVTEFKTETETETTKAADVVVNGQDQVYDEELERSKIKEMRALLLSRQPSFSQEVDDLVIRRFLRTRDLDIEKAYSMLIKYINWRKEFVPNGSISPSQIPNDLAQNKSFMQGHDKLGRPIVVSFGGRHKQTSLEEFSRYYTFTSDKICSRMLTTGQEQYLAIYDLKGWGYSNSDVRGNIAALSILQDYYPETMGKLLIVNVPSLYMTVWKMISPFFDSKTKKKIMFVENKRLRETLLSYIDESQLPETYGGKLSLVPIQDC